MRVFPEVGDHHGLASLIGLAGLAMRLGPGRMVGHRDSHGPAGTSHGVIGSIHVLASRERPLARAQVALRFVLAKDLDAGRKNHAMQWTRGHRRVRRLATRPRAIDRHRSEQCLPRAF